MTRSIAQPLAARLMSPRTAAILHACQSLALVGLAGALYATGAISLAAFLGIVAGLGGIWSGVAGVIRVAAAQSAPTTAAPAQPAPGAPATPAASTPSTDPPGPE